MCLYREWPLKSLHGGGGGTKAQSMHVQKENLGVNEKFALLITSA